MPYDSSGAPQPKPQKPQWPPKDMWVTTKVCQTFGEPCNGTAYGKGQACNFCGKLEDGSSD
ncbi:MAG: hypothetical protein ACI92I_000773 [Acidimicrobiales bacterium]|jgi:hypothetical protein